MWTSTSFSVYCLAVSGSLRLSWRGFEFSGTKVAEMRRSTRIKSQTPLTADPHNGVPLETVAGFYRRATQESRRREAWVNALTVTQFAASLASCEELTRFRDFDRVIRYLFVHPKLTTVSRSRSIAVSLVTVTIPEIIPHHYYSIVFNFVLFSNLFANRLLLPSRPINNTATSARFRSRQIFTEARFPQRI